MAWRAYLSQLKQQLTDAEQRALVIIAGDHLFHQQVLATINELYPAKLSLSSSLENSIWPEHIHQLLGQEHEAVVFDYHSGLTPNKLAAISGTVKAGGALFLLTPALDALAQYCDPSYQQYLSVERPVANLSLFNQRISEQINNLNCAVITPTGVVKYIDIVNSQPPSLTQQAQVVEKAVKQLGKNQQPFLLTSHRGRGKSAALGLIAAELVLRGNQVFITAMQQDAVKNVFKHATQALANKADLINQISFVPPDVLLSSDNRKVIVLVDEAASIPLPLLHKLLTQFPRIGFASTVHGYEGSGRGFSLKFIPYLTQHSKQCLHAELTQPIRFAEHDPLELAIDKLLLLDADFKQPVAGSEIEFQAISQHQLAHDESLLRQLFSLLVCAHYQTSPNDLRHLLDGNNVSLYIAKQGATLVGAVLLSDEGQLSDLLSQAIVAGKRRPKGHLLAQSVAQLALQPELLNYRYARIVRIAIHPELQNKGVGSALLNFVEQNAAYDAIGASFASNEQLLAFWQANQFELVSLGFKRDKASGEHAALVLKSQHPAIVAQTLQAHFRSLFIAQLSRSYQQLSPQLVHKVLTTIAPSSINNPLTHFERMQISALATGALQLELAFASLYKSLLMFPIFLNKLEFVYVNLLIRLILQNTNEAELVAELKLSGKRELSRMVQQATAAWLDIIDCETTISTTATNNKPTHSA
jgi:tRNA(Met) cytidine acetyltransferase